jgi:hypothetical protein
MGFVHSYDPCIFVVPKHSDRLTQAPFLGDFQRLVKDHADVMVFQQWTPLARKSQDVGEDFFDPPDFRTDIFSVPPFFFAVRYLQ